MPIVLHRIDDRLIHGQVVVGWGKPLDLGFVVLVDDDVAASDWEQELYRMGVPPGMRVHFHGVDEAVAALPAYADEPGKGVLLTGSVAAMQRLVAAGAPIEAVNVGGLHAGAGRRERLRYVFLTDDDAAGLRDIAARGVTVTAQDVPSARPVPLAEFADGPVS